MKIMTLTSYATEFSLHRTNDGAKWQLDKTPDDLVQVNQNILAMLNRFYLPNFAIYEFTPYATLLERLKKEFKYLTPKLKQLVPDRKHGEGVPKDAIV